MSLYNLFKDISEAHHLKLTGSERKISYSLSNYAFKIHFRVNPDDLRYYITHKYGLIGLFFSKQKIKRILDDVRKNDLQINLINKNQ